MNSQYAPTQRILNHVIDAVILLATCITSSTIHATPLEENKPFPWPTLSVLYIAADSNTDLEEYMSLLWVMLKSDEIQDDQRASVARAILIIAIENKDSDAIYDVLGSVARSWHMLDDQSKSLLTDLFNLANQQKTISADQLLIRCSSIIEERTRFSFFELDLFSRLVEYEAVNIDDLRAMVNLLKSNYSRHRSTDPDITAHDIEAQEAAFSEWLYSIANHTKSSSD